MLDGGQFAEAKKTFEEDLQAHPHNGWSIYGLYRAAKGLKQTKEAEEYLKRYKIAWKDADFDTTSSCLCLPAK